MINEIVANKQQVINKQKVPKLSDIYFEDKLSDFIDYINLTISNNENPKKRVFTTHDINTILLHLIRIESCYDEILEAESIDINFFEETLELQTKTLNNNLEVFQVEKQDQKKLVNEIYNEYEESPVLIYQNEVISRMR